MTAKNPKQPKPPKPPRELVRAVNLAAFSAARAIYPSIRARLLLIALDAHKAGADWQAAIRTATDGAGHDE